LDRLKEQLDRGTEEDAARAREKQLMARNAELERRVKELEESQQESKRARSIPPQGSLAPSSVASAWIPAPTNPPAPPVADGGGEETAASADPGMEAGKAGSVSPASEVAPVARATVGTIAEPGTEPRGVAQASKPAARPAPMVMAVPIPAPPAPIARPAARELRYAYGRSGKPKVGDRAAAVRCLTAGVEAQLAGRTDDALGLYEQAGRSDPSLFEAHYNSGLLAYQENRPVELPALETALAIQPESAKARYLFGMALARAGYARDAANELEKVVAANSEDVRAHFALGHLYAEQLKEPKAARPHYVKVLELQPQHPQATAVRFWIEQHP
jgi:tetratricopeptide (TPR) repeat protein